MNLNQGMTINEAPFCDERGVLLRCRERPFV